MACAEAYAWSGRANQTTMNTKDNRNHIVEDAYRKYHDRLTTYIACRVGDRQTAEDLCHDVFLRVLEYKMLAQETVASLVYIIARHLVVDRMRHQRSRKKAWAKVCYTRTTVADTTLHDVLCRDLEHLEQQRIARIAPMRAKVYRLSRFKDKTTADIAKVLGISNRTAESHLFSARKEIRQFMQGCI